MTGSSGSFDSSSEDSLLPPTSLNEVWFTSDGISWTQLQVQGPMWSARQVPNCVSYDGKLWVIGGQGTKEIWSLEI